MTVSFRLGSSGCLRIREADFRVLNQSVDGVVLQRVDDPTICQSYSPSALCALIEHPETRLLRDHLSADGATARLRPSGVFWRA